MDKSQENANASPPSIAATIHSLVDSVRGWLDSFLHLAVLEGKKAGIGLALMLGFGVGAAVLLITSWLALIACVVAALVENKILGWTWSLLIAALLSFAGAGGLVFLAIKRSKALLFCATRRQLGLELSPHGAMNNSSSALEESAETRVAASKAGINAQVHALNFGVRRLVKSPYVIAGLAIGTAAVGYFAVTRSAKLRTPSSRSAARGSLMNMLKTAQMLLPLLGALGVAATVPKRNPRAFPVVISQPPSAAQGSTAAVLRGNWLSQQLQMIKAAVKGWVDDYAPSMGAALSYYTLFSLAPLLIIVIAVAGMVFGQEAAQGEIVAQLRGIMGVEGAVAVEGMLKAVHEPAKGVVATIVGIAILLLGATAIFAELQSALDRIWRVPAPKKVSGIWHLLRARLLSFGLVLGLGFLLVVSLVVSAALAALGKWWGGWFDGWKVFLEILNFVVSFGILTLLFAMIYKIMPRANISWRDVWTGASVTALLFTIGKVLIGLYLGKSSLASGFGTASSLVMMIAWVYYSAQIFLFGAEYTWVYANRHGSRMQKPVPGDAPAVPGRSSDLLHYTACGVSDQPCEEARQCHNTEQQQSGRDLGLRRTGDDE